MYQLRRVGVFHSFCQTHIIHTHHLSYGDLKLKDVMQAQYALQLSYSKSDMDMHVTKCFKELTKRDNRPQSC